MNAASNNENLTDTALAAKPGLAGLPLTVSDYIAIRKKLAAVFLANAFDVEIRPLQGQNLNIQSYSIANHRGVTL